MPKFEKGAEVVVTKPLIGKVEQIKFDENTGAPRYRVGWTGADNHQHHRWFNESEISAS